MQISITDLVKPLPVGSTVQTKIVVDVKRSKMVEKHLNRILFSLMAGSDLVDIRAEITKTQNILKRHIGRSKKATINRKVDFTCTRGFGRFYSDDGFVNITRPIRHFLCRDNYIDLDVCNCHPVIAEQLYPVLTNKPSVAIKRLNNERKRIFAEFLEDHKLPKDSIKKLGFACLYDGSIQGTAKQIGIEDLQELTHRCKQNYDLFVKAKREFAEIMQHVKQIMGSDWELLPCNPGKENTDRADVGKLSSFFQHIERQITEHIAFILNGKFKCKVADYQYDGVFLRDVQSKTVNTWIPAIEQFIYEKTGFRVKLETKRMENYQVDAILESDQEAPVPKEVQDYLDEKEQQVIKHIESNNPFDPFFHNSMDTERVPIKLHSIMDYSKLNKLRQQYFENFCVKIENPAMFVRVFPESGDAVTINRQNLLVSFENLRHGNKNQPWITECWLKSASIKTYTKTTFVPYTINPPPNHMVENKFNMFKGFMHSVTPPDNFKMDQTKIQPILDHLHDIWCGGDQMCYKYILDWMASIAQTPWKKSLVAVVLVSIREGAGKNSIMEFLKEHVFGNQYIRDVSNINDLTRQFNMDGMKTIFTVCNEIGSQGGAYRNADSLKDMITRKTQRIETKGVDPIQMSCFNNFMLTSQYWKWVAKISSSDRRYFCLDADNKRCNDVDYFTNLFKFLTPESGKHFWYYLLSRDLSTVNLRNIPMTDLKRDMASLSYDPFIKTLIELENQRADGEDRFTAQELMLLYNHVNERDSIKSTRSFSKQFKKWSNDFFKVCQIGKTRTRGFLITPEGNLELIRQVLKDPVWYFPDAPENEYEVPEPKYDDREESKQSEPVTVMVKPKIQVKVQRVYSKLPKDICLI